MYRNITINTQLPLHTAVYIPFIYYICYLYTLSIYSIYILCRLHILYMLTMYDLRLLSRVREGDDVQVSVLQMPETRLNHHAAFHLPLEYQLSMCFLGTMMSYHRSAIHDSSPSS